MNSQNGWPVLEARHTYKWVIPEVGRHLVLAPGPAGFLLAHLALWFHEQLQPLDGGVWDDWGYAVRMVRGSSSTVSNHSSGTAVDLNATKHPLGVRNTFTLDQEREIRARLAGRYAKAIRWGGDYQSRADEMHFEIVGSTADVLALARTLRNSPRGRRVGSANSGSGV